MELVYKYLIVVVVVFMGLMREEVMATQHVVGGSQGWDESTDFTTWVSGQKFQVGDQLVFKYTSGLHSVVELGSESAYKSCDTSSSLQSLNGGNNVVKLTKPGTRYFACGTLGHCGQGMKVEITTAAAGTDVSSTPASSSSSSSSSSSAASTTVATIPHGASMVISIFVASLFLVLL